jgi:hypothetical protein
MMTSKLQKKISRGKSRALSAYLAPAFCFVLIVFAARPPAATSQEERQVNSREIVSDDFTKNRKASKPPATPPAKSGGNRPNTTTSNKKRRVYRPAQAQAKPIKPPTKSSVLAQVGITLWRLRPATASDRGARVLAHEQSGTIELTPVRAEAETPLALGERVRLTIESPLEGYLYVIDREAYSDGSLGSPTLIFPTLRTRGGDNFVRAGMLIDIPAQTDSPPFFLFDSKHPYFAGELLTVIVTAQPLEGIKIERNAIALTPEQVKEWERKWGAETERFELENGTGDAWTPEEKEAGRMSGRALTQEDPLPQTIYRVAIKPGNPLLIPVRLRARD